MAKLYGFISRQLADAQFIGQLFAWPCLIALLVVYLTVYLAFGATGVFVLTMLILFTVWLVIMLLLAHLVKAVYRFIRGLFLGLIS
jgi:hypothetical protein